MKWFTALYPNGEGDICNTVPVMIELSPAHMDMIKQAQDAVRQLTGVIDIILRLSVPEFSSPKITFLDKRFNKSWTKYESMFVKITGDLPETEVSIGVSYINSYGHIEERSVYESAYDQLVDHHTEYIVGNDFYENYLQDVDSLLEMKKFVSIKDYEFLVKESGISDEGLQEAVV